MTVLNTDEAVKIRKHIAGDSVDSIAAFLRYMENGHTLMEMLLFAGMANTEGGLTLGEIQKTHSWFQDAILRLNLLQGYLQGMYSIRIDEDDKALVGLSDLAMALGGTPGEGTEKEFVQEVSKRGGWLGVCHGEKLDTEEWTP